jgi:hypothetical protein
MHHVATALYAGVTAAISLVVPYLIYPCGARERPTLRRLNGDRCMQGGGWAKKDQIVMSRKYVKIASQRLQRTPHHNISEVRRG